MRYLIDGYNLMHAMGLMNRRFGPDGLRKARHRFLNNLAAALGPVDAHQTTIVFDASEAPAEVSRQTRHKGLTVDFAIEDDEADERIEHLIQTDSAPKRLSVVSSDHRIRQAARRRGANDLTCDEFLSMLEDRKRRPSQPSTTTPTPEERARLDGPSPQDAKHWLEIFGDAANELEALDELSGRGGFVPTPEEIARIEREVEDEARRSPGSPPRKRR